MAICEYQMKYVKKYVFPRVEGIEMLELGDQIFNPFLAEKINFNVAKPYYESLGYNHTSIDTNGKHGAVRHDLTKARPEFNNKFNVITNHGTIEHIINQYPVFKNLHDWAADGCVYIHAVPMIPKEHIELLGRPWPKHGFWEYSSVFWMEFAKACDYELINASGEIRNPAVKYPMVYYSSSAYMKKENSRFLDKSVFDNLVKKHMIRCQI